MKGVSSLFAFPHVEACELKLQNVTLEAFREDKIHWYYKPKQASVLDFLHQGL